MGHTPALHEKIKIFGIDDDTFFFLGDWVLSTEQWVKLLSKIAETKPRAIFIDAAFSKIIGDGSILQKTKGFDVPIYVGGHSREEEVRHLIPFNKELAELANHQVINTNSFAKKSKVYYSYAAEYASIFTDSGHFNYNNDFMVDPVVEIRDQYLVPHLALHLSQSIDYLSPYEVRIDGQSIRLTPQGQILVNFSNRNTYEAKTYSLEVIFRKVDTNKPIKSIAEDDIVFIIPHLYTGNSDMRQTPFGSIPGGYIIASMINSILQKNWINSDMHRDFTYSLLAGCFSFIFVYFFSNLVFLLSMTAINIVWITTATYFFTYHGLEIPFLNPILSFTIPGMLIYFAKNRQIEKHTENLRHAFEGHVPAETLQVLMRQKTSLQLETSERVLTIMFIDLVGFSIFSHHLPPKEAFQRLQEIMTFITKIVHAHGGIVDRTLGDGLLCYFGYSFFNASDGPISENHADNALRCAMELQQTNIRRIFEGMHLLSPKSFPLRIGINTAACYVGNLGSMERIDFTVVGNGVNFAKRLESCCNANHILISEATYRFLKNTSIEHKSVVKRAIRIKHHDQEIQTFELNPYVDNKALMDAVERYYQEASRKELLLESWQILDDRGIRPQINGKIAEFVLLTSHKMHIRSFMQWPDLANIELCLDISPDGGVTAAAPDKFIQGKLHLLTKNSDQSFDYVFIPDEQYLTNFADIVTFVNKHSVTDSNINPNEKTRQVVYGARA